ncbi:anthranilate phosphoribosyltransferase [Leucobacter soli]|uniref:Anthranilate phosphoribosyltransferase n=1 Tax=Leucobacter soli TaxID=2812850 RepID=A0A916JWC1_9MICO|nr:anthranilate phosphoribosyltransferase [Leucobacter soli]CAG7602996.1 Anthranilate phosphoribosyltransferase [Leucobacter soli]
MIEERSWPTLLTALLERRDLSVSEADWAMGEFMTGRATPAQMGAFLVALQTKGVTVDEIVGFRDAILAEAREVPLPPATLDIVGTGGDRFGTVNVSTMASVIAAASGAPVAKHGNRAASSKSGSSDVLTALGINFSIEPEQLREAFDRTGIAFVHAARYLPGFRHVAPVRAELGIQTVFNYLGPLCNPVRPEATAAGVADAARAPLFADLFRFRGAAALVFRGDDGLDELTTTGHSHIWEVSRGALTEHDLDPRDLGIPRARMDELIGGTPDENAVTVHRVFAGETGPVRDIALLNAAAGLVAYDLFAVPESVERPMLERLADKLSVAAEAVDSGAVAKKLADWIEATNAFESTD